MFLMEIFKPIETENFINKLFFSHKMAYRYKIQIRDPVRIQLMIHIKMKGF